MGTMPSSAPQRFNKLQLTVITASWWLMSQGLVLTLMGMRTADVLRLRYQDNMVPYIDATGLAQLCLGLFVNRAVREARRQYLTVDILVLLFIVSAIQVLNYRLHGNEIFWFEWLSVAVNASLAVTLILYRTRGSEMEAPGSLVARDVKDVLRQAQELGAALVEKAPRKAVAPLAPSAAAVAETPALSALAAPVALPEAPKPKPKSEAMPHMD